MPVSIQLADAAFTKYTRQALPPYVANCLGYWLFGDTEAKSLKNRLVNPAAPLCTKVGTVTVASNYISVTNPNANGYRSGITRVGALTMVVVCDAAQRLGIGHQNYSSYDEVGMTWNTTSVSLTIDSFGAVKATLAPSPALGSGWVMLAATYADPVPSVHYGRSGVITSAVGANYSQSALSTEFRIGATGVSSSTSNMAACLYFDRALSAAELLEVYTWLKDDAMAARGITLL